MQQDVEEEVDVVHCNSWHLFFYLTVCLTEFKIKLYWKVTSGVRPPFYLKARLLILA